MLTAEESAMPTAENNPGWDMRYVDDPDFFWNWIRIQWEKKGKLHYANKAIRHETLPVQAGDSVEFIDAKLAKMIYLMWSAGISTIDSCESLYDGKWDRTGKAAPHIVWLQFTSYEDVLTFLSLTAKEDRTLGSVYDRMTGSEGEGEPWDWGCAPQMYGCRPRMEFFVMFPFDDVAEIVKQLEWHVKKEPWS